MSTTIYATDADSIAKGPLRVLFITLIINGLYRVQRTRCGTLNGLIRALLRYAKWIIVTYSSMNVPVYVKIPKIKTFSCVARSFVVLYRALSNDDGSRRQLRVQHPSGM
jgi:hypothetical protein